MGSKNLIVILSAVAVAAVCVAGSALLGRRLDDRRVDLQLTFSQDLTQTLEPAEALMVTMFGSFRGLAIDLLWQKANKLKEENKVYAAKDYADLITKLQPHFKEVWVFHSWNMAYNISVMTKTQPERWMWVNNGIALLRDKGVVYNPDSVAIHKQLAWTFLHKIGRISDDMHWYYKTKLAEEWQDVLGPPAPSAKVVRLDLMGEPVLDEAGRPTPRWAVIEAFAPIEAMDQLFFAHNELPRVVRLGLGELLQRREAEMDRLGIEPVKDPVMGDLAPLIHLRPQVFRIEAVQRLARWPGEDRAYADRLRELVGLCEDKLAEAGDALRAADERFIERFPEAAEQVAALRAHGFDLDHETLVSIGQRIKWLGVERLGYQVDADRERGVDTAFLNAWLMNADPAAARVRDRLILPYLRAKVLRTHYHMSPSYMFELMEGEWLVQEDHPITERDESRPEPLPLDWRHPASHGLYWASRGVWVAKSKLHRSDTYHREVLNTYRLVCHAMQALTHNGRITYDPLSNYYEQMPDPDFVEAYLRVFYGSGESIGGMFTESAAPESYKTGHRHFLEWSVRLLYERGYIEIAGELDANELYDELGRTYGKDDEDLAKTYSQPLERFALSEHLDQEGIDNPDKAHRAIYGRLWLAFKYLYANEMPESARRQANQAKRVYDRYQAEFAKDTKNTHRSRVGLEPWDQMVSNALAEFMVTSSPVVSMELRQIVWNGMMTDPDNALRCNQVWDRIRDPLYRLAELNPSPAMSVEVRFPEPPGMAEYRRRKQEEGGADDRTKTGRAADQYGGDGRPSP